MSGLGGASVIGRLRLGGRVSVGGGQSIGVAFAINVSGGIGAEGGANCDDRPEMHIQEQGCLESRVLLVVCTQLRQDDELK